MPTEETNQDIRQLILETESSKDKAMLLILLKISDNLGANTKMTQGLTEQLTSHISTFAEHEKKEMALINQGRGAFRVALFSLTVFQAAFAWYGTQVVSDFKETREAVANLQSDMKVHKEYHIRQRE